MFVRMTHWLDRMSLIAAGVAACSIVVMVTTGVIMRALGQPLLFADEYSGFLMAAMVFLALPAVTRDRTHISAEFLVTLATPRMRWALGILADVLLLFYTVALLWLSARLNLESYEAGLRSQGLMSTPIFIPQIAMVIGLAGMVIRAAMNLGDSLFGKPS